MVHGGPDEGKAECYTDRSPKIEGLCRYVALIVSERNNGIV